MWNEIRFKSGGQVIEPIGIFENKKNFGFFLRINRGFRLRFF